MGTLNEDLSAIKEVEDKIVANKVARFAYTNKAYRTNDADGVAEYDVNNDQNIPIADASVLKVNETVLSKGYRAQASSITRMLVNHFFGRMSYNLNKVNDNVSNLIATLIGHRGTANGFATLDASGRIPYSQLPESAMEYKGQWNAETNTPTLADGNGTKGDFYVVSVSGTQNLGSGNIQFFVNDRAIYDGSVWSRLSAGDVKTVNNISPANGNVALTGENIPVSPTDPTLLSAPLTTDRYADSSVTNAKIKDPISVAKGGTGATDAKNGFMNLANGLTQAENPQDAEYMIYKSGTNWGLYTLSTFWDYIKNKISSVLGLTATQYNGNAKTATHADTADRATHADRADTADNVTHADTADRATHADRADKADTADNVTHADTADRATHADRADKADIAVNAANSYRLGGYIVREDNLGGSDAEATNYWTYVKSSKFTSNSGYIKYANGLIIQWGYVAKHTDRDKTETITFPISYVQIPALNATWLTGHDYSRLNIVSISATQAVIRNTDSRTVGYTWMSIGY